MSNVHNIYQFPDCLVTVALWMPLVASMLTLAMISSILLFWAAVLCGEMPLSVVGGFG